MNRLDYWLVAGGRALGSVASTFSSFSLQTLNLSMEGDWLRAASNVFLSVTLCLGAVWIGHLCDALISR